MCVCGGVEGRLCLRRGGGGNWYVASVLRHDGTERVNRVLAPVLSFYLC